MGTTPPTPGPQQRACCFDVRSPLAQMPSHLNVPHTPAAPSSGLPCTTPGLCTPANPPCSITPPANLRRDSLHVPASAGMVRLAKGSGVSVYRLERSPLGALPRSPWVIKKSDNSPMVVRRSAASAASPAFALAPTCPPARAAHLPTHLAPPPRCDSQGRERRRVERALELESRVLSRISHPHIVGFRAAQRLPDGRLGLVLEACECSLYGLIQERQFEIGSVSGPLLAAPEVMCVCRGVALALVHLHHVVDVLHGDIKSANVLVSRDLGCVKLCDLGVSMPLTPSMLHGDEPRGLQLPETHHYQGTEQWRPPEACGEFEFYEGGSSSGGESPTADDGHGHGHGAGGAAAGASSSSSADAEPRPPQHAQPPPLTRRDMPREQLVVSDRSDIWAMGLVVWEMLTGEVPHSDLQSQRGDDAYRDALGTRPPMPPAVSDACDDEYRLALQIHLACTQREPRARPSARQLSSWIATSASIDNDDDTAQPMMSDCAVAQ